MFRTLRKLAVCAVVLTATVAVADHNPSLADLSGTFRIALQTARDGTADAAAQATIDKAVEVMTGEFKKHSAALNKTANEVGRLDKALEGNQAYSDAADLFVGILQVSTVADSNQALLAVAQAVLQNPLGPAARTAQKLAKLGEKTNATVGDTTLARKKRIKAIFKLQKANEGVIRKYGG